MTEPGGDHGMFSPGNNAGINGAIERLSEDLAAAYSISLDEAVERLLRAGIINAGLGRVKNIETFACNPCECGGHPECRNCGLTELEGCVCQ